jgi:hypothetical protein
MFYGSIGGKKEIYGSMLSDRVVGEGVGGKSLGTDEDEEEREKKNEMSAVVDREAHKLAVGGRVGLLFLSPLIRALALGGEAKANSINV